MTKEQFERLHELVGDLKGSMIACHKRNLGDNLNPLQDNLRAVINKIDLANEEDFALLYKICEILVDIADSHLPRLAVRMVLEGDS